MKFKFPVKHNGVTYEPGQEVPIGKEPRKKNEVMDLTTTEIRKELKELGITRYPSNKKEDLAKQLLEAREAQEIEEEEVEEEIDSEEEVTETDNEEEVTEDEESEVLKDIINE